MISNIKKALSFLKALKAKWIRYICSCSLDQQVVPQKARTWTSRSKLVGIVKLDWIPPCDRGRRGTIHVKCHSGHRARVSIVPSLVPRSSKKKKQLEEEEEEEEEEGEGEEERLRRRRRRIGSRHASLPHDTMYYERKRPGIAMEREQTKRRKQSAKLDTRARPKLWLEKPYMTDVHICTVTHLVDL